MSVIVLGDASMRLPLKVNHQQRKPTKTPTTSTAIVVPAAIATNFFLVSVLTGAQMPFVRTASSSHMHTPWFDEALAPHPSAHVHWSIWML